MTEAMVDSNLPERELEFEWVVEYALKFQNNDRYLDDFFEQKTRDMNWHLVTHYAYHIDVHCESLEKVRHPLSMPKPKFYLGGILGGFLLHYSLAIPLLTVTPLFLAGVIAWREWSITGKYIQGYTHLTYALDELSDRIEHDAVRGRYPNS